MIEKLNPFIDPFFAIQETNLSVLALSKKALFVERKLQSLADLNNLIQIYYYLPNRLLIIKFSNILALCETLDHLNPY